MNAFKQAVLNIQSYTPLIGLFVSCTGWIVAAYIAYHFAVVRAGQEKAEKVFEEVAVLIEGGHSIRLELDASLRAKRPPETRERLWQALEDLQRSYASNHSRLQFLTNKYFGPEIASHLDFAIDGTINYGADRQECEREGALDHNIAAYNEGWLGDEYSDGNREWDGKKWQMMKKCGMDVRPFVRAIKLERRRNPLYGKPQR